MNIAGRPLAVADRRIERHRSGAGASVRRLRFRFIDRGGSSPHGRATRSHSRVARRFSVSKPILRIGAGWKKLSEAIGDRRVAALIANAGHGLGKGFLDQSFDDISHVVDTNITGTIYLIHRVGSEHAPGRRRQDSHRRIDRRASCPAPSRRCTTARKRSSIRSHGRCVTSWKDTGITVTCLMPGPRTPSSSTARISTTPRWAATTKDDPAMVARVGFKAMMDGEGDVVAGLKNKMRGGHGACDALRCVG